MRRRIAASWVTPKTNHGSDSECIFTSRPGGNVSDVLNLGVCPENSKHQITEIHASREGMEQYCRQCAKWRWKIDLRPIRAEIRALGGDPDAGVLEDSGCRS